MQGFSGRSGPIHDRNMLEDRVSRLEQDMTEVKTILRDLAPAIARIDERTRHLPTQTFVVSTVIAIVMLVIAVIALAPSLQSTVTDLFDPPPPVTDAG